MWICAPAFAGEKIETLHKQCRPEAPQTHPEKLQNYYWFVRKRFLWDGTPCSLSITADDAYRLYCNGQFVGQGPAQAYAFRYPYLTYNLTPYLKRGENVLAVPVYYIGTRTRAYQSGDLRQGLWAELRAEDGRLLFASDGTWKAKHITAWQKTEVIGYNTQFREVIDAAALPEGWKEPGFEDADWPQATELPADDHTLVPQETTPVAVYFQRPVQMELRGSVLFCDMGAEVTGSVVLKAAAENGGTVEVRCGEELNEDGTVRFRTRCNCDYRNEWLLSGRQTDEVGFFDYMAFRYFEISAPEGSIDLRSVGVRVRHYPIDETACTLQGNKDAEQIFAICKRGVMLGAQEAFVDCPSREKGQYLGDGTITLHSHLLLTGDPVPYRKFLLDFAASAKICPGLMAVAPGGEMQEIADYSCQYPEQLLTYYRLTGDRETVSRLMSAVDGLEDYFDRYRNADGLLEKVDEKWNLVDWPDNLRDGYDFPLTQPIGPGVHNVINAFYYGLKRDADRLRRLLGLPLRGEADAVRKAYLRAFRLPGGLFCDAVGSHHTSLHANALPLYYGITPAENTPAAVRLIREKGLCCGVYFAYFVLKGLAAAGEYGLMNELLFSDGIHSWKNMLREGATTCFEAWGKEQKWNTSLCHPWASAPVILLIEDVIGLQPVQPGFADYTATPHLPEQIQSLQLKIHTVRGNISVFCTQGEARVTDDFSGQKK